MNKVFKAESLEKVYENIKNEYSCSITDLEIKIIQEPSKGFLGFGKKEAIVEVIKIRESKEEIIHTNNFYEEKEKKINLDISKKIQEVEKDNQNKEDKEKEVIKTKINLDDDIFNNFYNKDIKIEDIIDEIKVQVNDLFKSMCFEIDEIEVSKYDEKTIFIKFDGKDSALLIGKEGYRYKALSYILFNWINDKYGLMIRLEIAEFLKNQEEAIDKYIEYIKPSIIDNLPFKTKTFDGILAHIALEKLREIYPNMYVAIKQNEEGQKYIIINEYKK